MKRIASFEVDHTCLLEGIYLSRRDGDVDTYDLRFKKPNGDVLENAAIHTVEHIFATFVRNSEYSDRIIYFGPMGCRTGFYFLVRGMSAAETVDCVKKAIDFTRKYEGEIPGVSAEECGNYRDHDLAGAKKICGEYFEKIKDLTEKDIFYKKQS